MPAPLAKGLIISISILLAAGYAVYENPQVRHWVDKSRRKIAIALHSLGDEIQPPRPSTSNSNPNSSRPGSNSRRSNSHDASTREDDSTEAVDRRRRAREEILERGRMMEEKRRAKSGEERGNARGMSFDDMVDREGKLKKAEAAANTTAAETVPEADGLRHRNTEAATDPFSDEKHSLMEFSTAHAPHADSPATLPGTPPHNTQSLLINTSAPPIEPATPSPLLTPTATSVFSDLGTPAPHTPIPNDTNAHFSVNEWAENSTSFYSPPRFVQDEPAPQEAGLAAPEGRAAELAGLELAMEELVNRSDAGGLSDADVDLVSEIGEGEGEGRSTPGSWTEVGSVVSEFD